MAINEKNFYASDGSRFIILFGAIFNFGLGFRWLYYFAHGFYYGIITLIIFIIIGFVCIFYFIKTRYVPIVKSGIGWILIKECTRNTGPYRSKKRVKNKLIKKADVEYTENGIFSLMISTSDNFRYFILYLTRQEREEIVQRLLKENNKK